MNSKYFFAAGIFIFLALLLAVPVFGQEGGPVVHRLTWQPVEYVSRYEVAVEVYTRANVWVTVIRKVSEGETFIDCPLFVGSYRFRVEVYDLLGNPGSVTDWVYFEVRPARRETVVPQPAQPERTEAEEETRRVVGELRESVERLHEEVGQLQRPGNTNPAPEESEKSIFRLEAAFQPIVILPFSDFNEIYATAPVQPLGFALRFSIMPIVTRIGVFGLELSPAWNFLANDILVTSRYTHLFNTQLSLAWQIRPLSRRTAIDFNLGGGVALVQSRFDFNEGTETHNVRAWNPSMSGGVSFVIFCTKTVFIKAGIDYLHIFTRDNMTLNYLRPSLSVGWWF